MKCSPHPARWTPEPPQAEQAAAGRRRPPQAEQPEQTEQDQSNSIPYMVLSGPDSSRCMPIRS